MVPSHLKVSTCHAIRSLVACHVPTLRLGLPGIASQTTYFPLASKLTQAREKYVFNKDAIGKSKPYAVQWPLEDLC